MIKQMPTSTSDILHYLYCLLNHNELTSQQTKDVNYSLMDLIIQIEWLFLDLHKTQKGDKK